MPCSLLLLSFLERAHVSVRLSSRGGTLGVGPVLRGNLRVQGSPLA